MMLGEPRLNVSILDADISPRVRERLQAQLQTAVRSLPRWPLTLLTNRMNELDIAGLQVIVEPVLNGGPARPLGLGSIDGLPAARLRPGIVADAVQWSQDPRYLMAKAIAYLAAPSAGEPFWLRWAKAVDTDGLRAKASESSPEWVGETDIGLLVEMFAAYALRDGHRTWSELPAIHAFLQDWRGQVA